MFDLSHTRTRAFFVLSSIFTFVWVCIWFLLIQNNMTGAVLQTGDIAALVTSIIVPPGLWWIGFGLWARTLANVRNIDALRRQLEVLVYPAEDTEQKVMAIADSLTNQAEQLRRASTEATDVLNSIRYAFRHQSQDLASAAQLAAVQAEQVAESLKRQAEDLGSMADKMDTQRQSLEEASAAHADFITATAQRAVKQVIESIQDPTKSLLDIADQVGSKISETIQAQIQTFSQSSELMTGRLVEAFQKQTQEIGSAASVLAKEAGGLPDVIRSQIELFGNASKEVMAESNQVWNQTVHGFKDLLLQESKTFRELMDNHIVQLRERLQDESGDMKLGLQKQVDEIVSVVNSVTKQTEILRQVTETQSEALRSATDQAAEMVKKHFEEQTSSIGRLFDQFDERGRRMEAVSRSNIQDMMASSDQITKTVITLDENFREQLRLVNTTVTSSQDLIKMSTKDLINQVESMSNDVQANLANSSETMKQDLARAIQQSDDISRAFRHEREEIARTVEFAKNEMANIRSMLKTQIDDVGSMANRIVGDAETISNSMRGQVSNMNEATQKASDETRKLRAIMQQQVDDLGTATNEAKDKVTQMQDIIQNQCQELRAATHLASTRVELISDSLKPFVAMLSDASQQTQKTMEASERFESTLRRQIDEIDRAITSGDRKLTNTIEIVSNITKQSTEVAEKFSTDAMRLVDAAREANQQAGSIKSTIRDNLDEMLNLSRKVGDLARDVRENMRGLTNDLNDMVSMTQRETGKIRSDMEGQLKNILSTAETVNDRLVNVSSVVDSKADALIKATDHAVNRTGEIGRVFASHTELLENAINKINNRANEVNDKLNRQGQEIAAILDKADSSLQKLSVNLTHKDRIDFLKTATSMTDEINTLARDIQGLIEADIPDDLLQKFQRGDKSIFARRLFKMKDTYTLPAVEQRYRKDEQFSSKVDKYLNRFEQLLADANRADPESVLSAAFITADIGKLYVVLAKSVGRQVDAA
ncbi:MAG: hypothetical protein K1X44_07000 [Alphaproteobacteria bacterium]|nr:hypothetical protein [Alphaproteobacteria bacterium]